MKKTHILTLIFLILSTPLVSTAAPLCNDIYISNLRAKDRFLWPTTSLQQIASELRGKSTKAKKDKLEELKDQLKEDPDNIDLLVQLYFVSRRSLERETDSYWDMQVAIAKKLIALKVQSKTPVSNAELVDYFHLLRRKPEGNTDALTVARELIKRDPDNKYFKSLEITGLLYDGKISASITLAQRMMDRHPDEIIWYELAVKAYNKKEAFHNRPYIEGPQAATRNADIIELQRILDKAVELPGANFFIINNFIRIELLNYEPGTLSGRALDQLLHRADALDSMTKDFNQQRTVEYRYAEIHYAAGQYQLSLQHFNASLSAHGKVSHWKQQFKQNIKKRLKQEQKENDEDIPDWQRHREQDWKDNNSWRDELYEELN